MACALMFSQLNRFAYFVSCFEIALFVDFVFTTFP